MLNKKATYLLTYLKMRGLGIRSVSKLGPSAFLASAARSYELQSSILLRTNLPVTPAQGHSDTAVDETLSIWQARYDAEQPDGSEAVKQRAWDMTSVRAGKDILWMNAEDSYTRARLLATSAPHSGDWLLAIPISLCGGLRLDDEAIRIAVGLRLGCKIGEPHYCVCGELVDARESHSLSCKHRLERLARHHSINDLIHRALIRANIPSIKEPKGLLRIDNKRPGRLFTKKLAHIIRRSKFVTQILVFTKKCKLAKS